MYLNTDLNYFTYLLMWSVHLKATYWSLTSHSAYVATATESNGAKIDDF